MRALDVPLCFSSSSSSSSSSAFFRSFVLTLSVQHMQSLFYSQVCPCASFLQTGEVVRCHSCVQQRFRWHQWHVQLLVELRVTERQMIWLCRSRELLARESAWKKGVGAARRSSEKIGAVGEGIVNIGDFGRLYSFNLLRPIWCWGWPGIVRTPAC